MHVIVPIVDNTNSMRSLRQLCARLEHTTRVRIAGNYLQPRMIRSHVGEVE